MMDDSDDDYDVGDDSEVAVDGNSTKVHDKYVIILFTCGLSINIRGSRLKRFVIP